MTSIPASRRARAMILAPLSCPSRPTFATITLIVCAMVYPYSNRSLNLVRHPFGSSSDLTQVVPEHVEADYEHGRDDELPEELVDRMSVATTASPMLALLTRLT